MNCGLELSLMCMDFESMVALHLCMFPKKKRKALDDRSEEFILMNMDLEIFIGS